MLTRFFLPLLAVVGVGLVMLYAVLLTAGAGGGYYLVEWALMMALLLFCARAVLAEYGRWVRLGFFLFFAAAIPGALIAAGVYLHSLAITAHAFVLFGACMLGWKLLEPVVEQCTGHTGRAPVKRKKIVFAPTFPFIDIYETAEPGGLAFSGDGLAALLVFGTLIFAAGDYLRLSRGFSRVLPPMPFALAFYAVAGGLISLSKLVQRVRETPGSVRLEGGFLRSWAGAMLAVLAICALLAWLLPKSPVIGTGSWVAGGARQLKDRVSLPESRMTYDDSRDTQATAPLGGRGPSDAAGVGKTPGKQRAVRPNHNPTKNPRDKAIDLLYNAATSFEGKSQQQEGDSPGKGSQSKAGGSEGSGEGQSDMSDRSDQSDHSGKQNQLMQALKNRPDRLLKLLLFLLLALLAAFALALLLFRVLRRYIWYGLAMLSSLLWAWVRARAASLLSPFVRRIRHARRERRLRLLMAGMQPFADPFAGAEGKPHKEIIRAAYAAFLAHLWLLGYERREAETDFDFAARLARQAKLDERAVMELTMGCVRSEFSPTPLTATGLVQVQRAYAQLIDIIDTRIPEEVRPEKMAAYRRLLAERQLAREEQQKNTPAAEPQEVAS